MLVTLDLTGIFQKLVGRQRLHGQDLRLVVVARHEDRPFLVLGPLRTKEVGRDPTAEQPTGIYKVHVFFLRRCDKEPRAANRMPICTYGVCAVLNRGRDMNEENRM